MTEVKMCGMCRASDASAAAQAGADYVGVILSKRGPRARTEAEAAAIFEAAGAAMRVGVFVDESADTLAAAARALQLDVLQLHGREAPSLVAAVRAAGPWRVWKAVRPRSPAEFLRALAEYANCVDGILVDGWAAGAAGGTGARFDWQQIGALRDHVPPGLTLVVAGGLDPNNVARAVQVLRPDAVDVSSGVESAVGEKSEARMRAFIAAARGGIGRNGGS